MTNRIPRETLAPLVADGMTYQQIAEHLGVTFDRVRADGRHYSLRARTYTPPRPTIPRATLEPLLAEGLTCLEAARRLGETEGRVRYATNKYGLLSKGAPKRRQAPILREVLEPLIAEGLTYQEMADRLGVTWHRARGAVVRMGLRTTRARATPASVDPEEVLPLVERGVTYREVARRLGTAEHRVRRIAQANGIRRGSHQPMTPEEGAWARAARAEGVPIPWIAETLGRSGPHLQRVLEAPPGAAGAWSTSWQGIRRNPELLALHHEFAPKSSNVRSQRVSNA